MQPPLRLALSSGSHLDDWPSDDALLSGLASGVWGAGRALVRRHQHRVYGLALSIVGDSKRAEEIAHEAFMRAWRDASSYEPERASVSTWLLTITRDLAHGSRRRRRGRRNDHAATLISADLQAVESMHDATSDSESIRAKNALSHLPVEQRRALVLATFYGYTSQEISEFESITLDAARARLRAGIACLRSHMHDAAISRGGTRAQSTTTRPPYTVVDYNNN